jgi:hypothetical protein
VLDEAVKSRVHVSLNYPALSLEQTLELFKLNIKRLKEIEEVRAKAQRASQGPGAARHAMEIRKEEILKFARKHYNSDDEALRWNGRQIRNAFQIAASLARFQEQQQQQQQKERVSEEETGTNGTTAPYIGKKHFKQVAQATADFDKMRRDVLGASDEELALQRMERATNTHHDDGPHQAGWDRPPLTRNKGSETKNDRRGHGGGHHHRSAPVQERPYCYDYDAYHSNGAARFDDRYELDPYRGEGYGGSGSVGRPSRRGKHRHRDQSPYERDDRDANRDRDHRDGRRAERARSADSVPTSRSVSLSRSSMSTSRSRSSSPSEDEARNQVRDATTKPRDSTRLSGRRSRQKSDAGGDSRRHGRRRVE